MEIHRILFPSRSHSSRSLLLYKTHVFLEVMMRRSKRLRASFLIVPCTALQWRAHQSCLQLEQNNIVTAATAPKRRKDFSRFAKLKTYINIEGIHSKNVMIKTPQNLHRDFDNQDNKPIKTYIEISMIRIRNPSKPTSSASDMMRITNPK